MARYSLSTYKTSLIYCCNKFCSSATLTSNDFENKDACKTRVISVNALTNERSALDLFLHKGRQLKHKGGLDLPKEAIEGLKNLLISIKKTPKQAQNEADQLNKNLDQRPFPATPEVIREIRRNIRLKIMEKNEDNGNEELFTDKMRSAKKEDINREVRKELRRTRFNWQPVVFDSEENAATYILARLARHYSEVYHVLNHFKLNYFVPESVLDYGSGTAATFWACHAKWGSKVKEYQLVEPNDFITRAAMDVLKVESNDEKQALIHPNIVYRRHLVPSISKGFDLVVAHRVLIEYGSRDSRIEILNSLWARTNRYLVVIESSSSDAFQALMECRDYLLTSGWEVHTQELRAKLDQLGLYNEDIDSVLNRKNLSHFECYTLLREMIPYDIDIPTKLPNGSIFAPCPHNQGCPLLTAGKVCKFNVRSKVVRVDGRRQSFSDGTDTNTISYFILEKGNRDDQKYFRVLKAAKIPKQVDLTVCTPFLGIQRITLSKKMGDIYKTLKSREPDEILNLEMRVVDSESKYNLFEETVEELKDEGTIS